MRILVRAMGMVLLLFFYVCREAMVGGRAFGGLGVWFMRDGIFLAL